MGKIDENKESKRSSLLQHAYDLFVDRGFAKTTIADIAKQSGLAKGTFYLYYKDKYDLRDELVARKSAQLLMEATEALKVRPQMPATFEEYLLALVDYILNYLQRNKMLLKFISKNLSWGIFRHAAEQAAGREDAAADTAAAAGDAPGAVQDTAQEGRQSAPALNAFYQSFLTELARNHYVCDDPDIMLFTIVELVSSAGYSCILYESPCDLATYLPHLHQSIHQILAGYRKA